MVIGGRLLVCLALLAALLACGAEANTRAGGQRLEQLREHSYAEDGEWTELEGMPTYQAPLVTQQSIEMAKRMNSGVPVQALSGPSVIQPRMVQKAQHKVMSLADGDEPSAFADIPPYVFILTFVGAVGGISVLFYFAERMWAKRQESGQ